MLGFALVGLSTEAPSPQRHVKNSFLRLSLASGGYAILRVLWDAEKSDSYAGGLVLTRHRTDPSDPQSWLWEPEMPSNCRPSDSVAKSSLSELPA